MRFFPREFFQRPNVTKREQKFCKRFDRNQNNKTTNKMNIYIFKNEQYAGPYTTDEVRTRLKSGAYAESDLAWYEGCGDPIPLSRVLRGLMSTPSTTEFSSA